MKYLLFLEASVSKVAVTTDLPIIAALLSNYQ
jgi:hypothetical protein